MLPRGQLRRVLEAPEGPHTPSPGILLLRKTLRSARSADLFQKTHNVEPSPLTREGPVVNQVKPTPLGGVRPKVLFDPPTVQCSAGAS